METIKQRQLRAIIGRLHHQELMLARVSANLNLLKIDLQELEKMVSPCDDIVGDEKLQQQYSNFLIGLQDEIKQWDFNQNV